MEEFTHSEASIQPDPSTVDGAEIIKAAVTEALSNPVSWTDFVKQLMKIKPKDIAPKEYMKLIGQQWRAREAGMKTPSHNERARVMPEVLPNMYELVQKGAGFKRKNEKVVKSKAVHASLSAIKEEGTDDASSESESDDSTEGVTLVESSSNDESGSDEVKVYIIYKIHQLKYFYFTFITFQITDRGSSASEESKEDCEEDYIFFSCRLFVSKGAKEAQSLTPADHRGRWCGGGCRLFESAPSQAVTQSDAGICRTGPSPIKLEEISSLSNEEEPSVVYQVSERGRDRYSQRQVVRKASTVGWSFYSLSLPMQKLGLLLIYTIFCLFVFKVSYAELLLTYFPSFICKSFSHFFQK